MLIHALSRQRPAAATVAQKTQKAFYHAAVEERENNPHQPFSREQCGRWGPQAESVVAPQRISSAAIHSHTARPERAYI